MSAAKRSNDDIEKPEVNGMLVSKALSEILSRWPKSVSEYQIADLFGNYNDICMLKL